MRYGPHNYAHNYYARRTVTRKVDREKSGPVGPVLTTKPGPPGPLLAAKSGPLGPGLVAKSGPMLPKVDRVK